MTHPFEGAGEPLRPHAEQAYQAELAALRAVDDRPRPPHWRLSPWAVVTYLMGGALSDGTVISPKYVGSRRLIEVAVATLATDRALLLLGVPGTAKSWVSEHLAAALRRLDLDDPGHLRHSRRGHQVRLELCPADRRRAEPAGAGSLAGDGGHGTRLDRPDRRAHPDPAEVQDALIMILSEKTLPIQNWAKKPRPCVGSM